MKFPLTFTGYIHRVGIQALATELGADLIEVSSVSQRNSDLMRDYDLVLTESDLDAWIKKISGEPLLSILRQPALTICWRN